MTTRTVHIITEEGDPVPATGDPSAVLSVADPAIFYSNGTPARILTADEVEAFKTVHRITGGE